MADEFAFTPQDLDEVRESCSLLADSDLEGLYRTSEFRTSEYLATGRPTVPTTAPQSADTAVSSMHSQGASQSALRVGLTHRKPTAAMDGAPSSSSPSSSPIPSAAARIFGTAAPTLKLAVPEQTETQDGGQGVHSPKVASRTVSISVPTSRGGGALDEDDDVGSSDSCKSPASELFGNDGHPVGGSMRRNVSSNALRIMSKSAQAQSRDMDSDSGAIDEEMERVRTERERRRSSRMPSQGSYSVHTPPQRSKSMSVIKADDIMRLLSMANRGSNAFLQPQLLTYVRAIFLEILRVRYWHDIEKGKIPRLCHSAKFLLYSIEVGVDEVEQETGVRDWLVIKQEITEQPLSIRILSYLDENIPHSCMLGYSTYYLGKLEARREKRAVYMLTSFIDAHEHAQSKVHEFISVDVEGEESQQSPEELKVIEESKEAVSES